MESHNYIGESYLFTCPACCQQITDSQIHEHIRNCELYSPRPSLDDSYSSVHSSDYTNSFRYNYYNSNTSSENKESIDSEESSVHSKKASPSKTQSIAVCPVCFYNFHNTRHPPLLLPACGHTICKPCLKDIRTKSHTSCCPICRSAIKLEIKSLPVNYALLELTEKKTVGRCPEHDLEYVAYCYEDDCVLCGACILGHKSHNCCLFTDEKLNALSEQKRIELKKDADELIVLKKNWTGALQQVEEHIQKINECVEIHKSGVINMEKKMIKVVQEGSKNCTQELSAIANHDSLKTLRGNFCHNVTLLDKEIITIQEKIDKFESLSMADKLEDPCATVIKDKKEIPSFGPALALLDRLKVFVDYKQAILSKKMF